MLALTFISTSIPPALWITPLLGACIGVYLFYHGFQLLQRKQLIMDTPSSKIRSAAMGLVEVSGLASGPYTLTAPITGVPCYYYRTMVWEWKQQGRSKSWVKEADESLHVPFYLDDGGSRVLVNPQGAEMEIHRDFQEEFSHSLFSSSLEIPGNVAGFLMTHGVETSAKVKIEEYCIKPKNALFILGTLASNPGIEVSATPVRTAPALERGLSFIFGPSLSISQTATVTTFKLAGTPEAVRSAQTVIVDPAEKAKIADALTKAEHTVPIAGDVSPGIYKDLRTTEKKTVAAAGVFGHLIGAVVVRIAVDLHSQAGAEQDVHPVIEVVRHLDLHGHGLDPGIQE